MYLIQKLQLTVNGIKLTLNEIIIEKQVHNIDTKINFNGKNILGYNFNLPFQSH